MPSIVIAQGGGPTAVINQTLCGAILAARAMYNSGKFAQLFPRLSVPHSVSCEMAGQRVDARR